jgi:hypothetical protein
VTPEQWARVFRAGRMSAWAGDPGKASQLEWALDGMAEECQMIADEEQGKAPVETYGSAAAKRAVQKKWEARDGQ